VVEGLAGAGDKDIVQIHEREG
jgi:hypothetical protein